MDTSPSFHSDDSTQMELEDQVTDYGIRLLVPPHSTDELLGLLDKLENFLSKVDQDPPKSMKIALLPAMKALITDELFRDPNEDVKVSVAACLSEISRITAPEQPYEDETMKEIFQLTIMALEKLSCSSGRCYIKALRVLATAASVRSCVMLLDLGCDGLIVNIFELFLRTIRLNHPVSVFKDMEAVMTWLINESDELPFQLVKPLLTSVKRENKSVSPISSSLGIKVLRNCSTIVKPHIIEAAKLSILDFDDYADIVTSIFNDGPDLDQMENVILQDAVHFVEDGSSVPNKERTAKMKKNKLKRRGVAALPSEIGKENNSNVIIKEHGELSNDPLSRGRCGFKGRKSRRGRPKKIDRITTEGVGRDSQSLGGDIPQPQAREKGPFYSEVSLGEGTDGTFEKSWSGTVKTSNDVRASGLSNVVIKDEGNHGDLDGKRTRDSANFEMHLTKKRRDKGSKRVRVKSYGEELVGSKIKVWWPLDKAFYDGAVCSYDPSKKTHKVLYADGDEEILDLSKERWELLDEQT